jgi:hypothetical protein
VDGQSLHAQCARRFLGGFAGRALLHSKSILEDAFKAASTNLAAAGESLN